MGIMNRCFVFVVAAIVAVAAFGAVIDASPYVNGCRSQEECEEARCCIFDWIPGVDTSIGLCVLPSTAGSICSPSCPRPSCEAGLQCVVDNTDPRGKVHLCQ